MKLAILFGGTSYEHEISIVSAITLKTVLEGENPLFIFLDSKREFYLISEDKMTTSTFSSGNYKKEKHLHLINGGFEYKSLFLKELYNDLRVINLIHGADGEDGTIVSILEFYKIRAISPRKEASVLSYNKKLTKIFANSVGIKTLNYEIISFGEERKLKELNFPVIVKPLNLGSSIGVSVVESEKDFEYALDIAFSYDKSVIIEPFIEDVKEFNIAGTFTNRLIVSNIEEPQKEKFLDFEKKYMDFKRDEKIESANISKELKHELIMNFQKIYSPLFQGSLIRCDFFVINDEVYLNEINSVPGSLAHYLFDNFVDIVKNIHIPEQHKISVNYNYIEKIERAKG
jgi:D-alanine-D-alanine ligase